MASPHFINLYYQKQSNEFIFQELFDVEINTLIAIINSNGEEAEVNYEKFLSIINIKNEILVKVKFYNQYFLVNVKTFDSFVEESFIVDSLDDKTELLVVLKMLDFFAKNKNMYMIIVDLHAYTLDYYLWDNIFLQKKIEIISPPDFIGFRKNLFDFNLFDTNKQMKKLLSNNHLELFTSKEFDAFNKIFNS